MQTAKLNKAKQQYNNATKTVIQRLRADLGQSVWKYVFIAGAASQAGELTSPEHLVTTFISRGSRMSIMFSSVSAIVTDITYFVCNEIVADVNCVPANVWFGGSYI